MADNNADPQDFGLTRHGDLVLAFHNQCWRVPAADVPKLAELLHSRLASPLSDGGEPMTVLADRAIRQALYALADWEEMYPGSENSKMYGDRAGEVAKLREEIPEQPFNVAHPIVPAPVPSAGGGWMTEAEARDNGDPSVCFQGPPPSEWRRAADTIAALTARADAAEREVAELWQRIDKEMQCEAALTASESRLSEALTLAGEYRKIVTETIEALEFGAKLLRDPSGFQAMIDALKLRLAAFTEGDQDV